MEKPLLEVCATVVTAQLRLQRMTPEEITASIRTLYGTLETLNRAEGQLAEGTGQASGVPDSLAALRRQPEMTLQKDRVFCLECGRSFRLLASRHLALHGLTARAYKVKWGIPLMSSLSSQTLTAHRRKVAKQMGMGKALADWRATRKLTA